MPSEILKEKAEYKMLAAVVDKLLQDIKKEPLGVLKNKKSLLSVVFVQDKENLEQIQRILNGTNEEALNEFIIARDTLYKQFPSDVSNIEDEKVRKAVVAYRKETLARLSDKRPETTAQLLEADQSVPVLSRFSARQNQLANKADKTEAELKELTALNQLEAKEAVLTEELLDLIRNKFIYDITHKYPALNELRDALKDLGKDIKKYDKAWAVMNSFSMPRLAKLSGYRNPETSKAIAGMLKPADPSQPKAGNPRAQLTVALISEKTMSRQLLGGTETIVSTADKKSKEWIKKNLKSGFMYNLAIAYHNMLFVSMSDAVSLNVAWWLDNKGEKSRIFTPYLYTAWSIVSYAIKSIPMLLLVWITQLGIVLPLSLIAIAVSTIAAAAALPIMAIDRAASGIIMAIGKAVAGVLRIIGRVPNSRARAVGIATPPATNLKSILYENTATFLENSVYVLKMASALLIGVPYFTVWNLVKNLLLGITMPFVRVYRFNTNKVKDLVYPKFLQMDVPLKYEANKKDIKQSHADLKKYLLRNYAVVSRDPILSFYMDSKFQENNFGYASNVLGMQKQQKLPPKILEALRKYIVSTEKTGKDGLMQTTGEVLLGSTAALKELRDELRVHNGPDTQWTKQLKEIFAPFGLVKANEVTQAPAMMFHSPGSQSTISKNSSTLASDASTKITITTSLSQGTIKMPGANIVAQIKGKTAPLPGYAIKDNSYEVGKWAVGQELGYDYKKYDISDKNGAVVGNFTISQSGEITASINADAPNKIQLVEAFALFIKKLNSPMHERTLNFVGLDNEQKSRLEEMLANANKDEDAPMHGIKMNVPKESVASKSSGPISPKPF